MFSGPNSADRDAASHSEADQSETAVQATVLQSGLAALKSKDYSGAIAHLESLSRLETSSANRFKAQMGLVRAYAGKGEAVRAIALCRQLSQSNCPQVRAWATQTLIKLTQKFPHALHQTPSESASPLESDSSSDLPPLRSIFQPKCGPTCADFQPCAPTRAQARFNQFYPTFRDIYSEH